MRTSSRRFIVVSGFLCLVLSANAFAARERTDRGLGEAGNSTPPASAAVVQLLANAGFEDGVAGWAGTTMDINVRAPEAAYQGDYLAWMGGHGQAHSETLYQDVSIPADAHAVTFSFWIKIETEETTRTRAYDKFYVQLRSVDGRVLRTLAKYSNLNRTRGYVEKTFDVSRFAGQNVQVFLKVIEDNRKPSSFFLDDFALIAR